MAEFLKWDTKRVSKTSYNIVSKHTKPISYHKLVPRSIESVNTSSTQKYPSDHVFGAPFWYELKFPKRSPLIKKNVINRYNLSYTKSDALKLLDTFLDCISNASSPSYYSNNIMGKIIDKEIHIETIKSQLFPNDNQEIPKDIRSLIDQLPIISRHLNKDIYIIDDESHNISVGDNEIAQLYLDRPSILLLYKDGSFFLIGLKLINTDISKVYPVHQLLFYPDHPLIKSINGYLHTGLSLS